jgi:hypothetical protein
LCSRVENRIIEPRTTFRHRSERDDHKPDSSSGRIAYIEQGHESHFTDAEARQVLPGLADRFVNVTVVRDCPNRGYTRLSAHDVVFTTIANGVRFVGDPL